MLLGVEQFSGEERLGLLTMFSPEQSKLRGDMLVVYKIEGRDTIDGWTSFLISEVDKSGRHTCMINGMGFRDKLKGGLSSP